MSHKESMRFNSHVKNRQSLTEWESDMKDVGTWCLSGKGQLECDCGNDSQSMRLITDKCPSIWLALGINGISELLQRKPVDNDYGYRHINLGANIGTNPIQFLGGG